MAVTIVDLKKFVRGAEGFLDDAPLQDVLQRFLDTAEALVAQEAPGAPDVVKDEATLRIAGYLYEVGENKQGSGFAMRNSGARSLLAKWRRRGAAVCEPV